MVLLGELRLFVRNNRGLLSVVPMNWLDELIPLFPPRLHPLLNTTVCQFGDVVVPILIINWFWLVSSTINPFAGLLIDSRDDVDILGMSNPLLVLLISNLAEELGVKVPIPILFCDKAK
jgi:hypothetical protein